MWLKLTNLDGKKILVNMDNAENVNPPLTDDVTRIWFGAENIRVLESVEEIEAMLGIAEQKPEPLMKERDMINKSVCFLDLSLRTNNALLGDNIKTIGDLIKKTKDDLLSINCLGKRSLAEIDDALCCYGLSLAE